MKKKVNFIPPFCPNKNCSLYEGRAIDIYQAKWYKIWGSYKTKLYQDKEITRFMCLECQKSFSTQSFSIDFAVKKKISYSLILNYKRPDITLLDWAKSLACSPATLMNRLASLSRYLLQELAADEKLKNLAINKDHISSKFNFMRNLLIHFDEYLTEKIESSSLEIRSLKTLLPDHIKHYSNCIYKIK